MQARKYDICPTESKCIEYRVGGPVACTRCPKNLGFVTKTDEGYIPVDDSGIAYYGAWIQYLFELWMQSKRYKIDESRLLMDEYRGLLMIDRANADADEKIAEIKKKEKALKELSSGKESNYRT